MLRKIDWESQIGRRIRLRDLHVFSAVVRCGSMAKAARELGVSQPAVSEVIADLEHMLGVRLLDRGPHGVVSTMYGAALFKRSVTVFDELRQSIRDIEFLSDPTVGELRIGCVESLSATILAESVLQFSRQFPRVAINVDNLTPPAIDLPGLRERKYDCILCWATGPGVDLHLDDLNIEMLFDDKMVVAAGTDSPWARRRRIGLAELVDEPWILPPPRTWGHAYLEEAFRAQGLDVPKATLVSFSIDLRTRLLAAGPYITVFTTSVMRRLRAELRTVARLPIELSPPPRPAAALVTLKNRTLSPLVQQFVKCVRAAAPRSTSRHRPKGTGW